MDDKTIKELRELEAAASLAPWEAVKDVATALRGWPVAFGCGDDDDGNYCVRVTGRHASEGPTGGAGTDARLIAAMRNALPRLLSERDALAAEVESLRLRAMVLPTATIAVSRDALERSIAAMDGALQSELDACNEMRLVAERDNAVLRDERDGAFANTRAARAELAAARVLLLEIGSKVRIDHPKHCAVYRVGKANDPNCCNCGLDAWHARALLDLGVPVARLAVPVRTPFTVPSMQRAPCEGCGKPSTGQDPDGVPLCDPCGGTRR